MNKLSLDGIWTLTTSADELRKRPIDATLPGDNYTALLNAGIIPDPYFGANEEGVQIYRKFDWTFSRSFTIGDDLLAARYIYLELSRVDLLCTVRINGKIACECDNQFAAYRPEVRNLLKKGKNTISFTMRPVEEEAAQLEKLYGDFFPQNPVCAIPRTNLIRKPHCSGGWDWGIALMTSGVYDSIILHAIEKSRIDYVYADQKHANGKVTVTAVAELYAPRNAVQDVTFQFNGETKTVHARLKGGENKVKTTFVVKNPELWWPNGYGKQPLYPLTVTTADDERTSQIGLRTMEIVNKRDKDGLSMTFRVNGIDIFAKGADWIPCDAFPSRQTRERMDDLLSSAILANMNTLRIWGGGQFETEDFYDLCDRKGILLWQDMMFSCSIYPARPKFIDSVKDELQFQIRRLRSHASIALWCGDNECIGATGWFGEQDRQKWLINYDRISRHLSDAVAKYDPTRTFWPSSPCGGPGNFSDGWHNDSEGDMHYWEVWFGGKDFTGYYDVRPRFCSEFGFQSYPTMQTIRTFCPEDEQNVFSPIMDAHQKCPARNQPIFAMLERHFRMPENQKGIFYLTQVQQALAIETGVEYWRTLKPRCQGTIFWQLNDDWPVISWSSIEYDGVWKLLNYHAKRFYSPVISTFDVNPKSPQDVLFTVSDSTAPGKATVTLEAWSFKGKRLKTWKVNVDLKPQESHRIQAYDKGALEKEFSEPIFLILKTEAKMADGQTFTHQNTRVFKKYKTLPLEKANVTFEATKDKNGFKVTLATDKPAFFVALASDVPGIFSDNSFTLLPGKPFVVTFTPKANATLDAFKKGLTLQHLRQTYK